MIIPKAFHTRCTETNAQNLNNIKYIKRIYSGFDFAEQRKIMFKFWSCPGQRTSTWDLASKKVFYTPLYEGCGNEHSKKIR